MRLHAFVLVGVGLAASCSAFSGSNTVSKENFKRAISEYVSTLHGLCLSPPTGRVPFRTPQDMSFYPHDGQMAEALLAAGLVSRKPVMMESGFKTPMKGFEYTLTAEGTKFYQTQAGSVAGSFCAGKYAVEDIITYTAPADFLGQRISQVVYRYSYTGAPSWATNKAIAAAYPYVKGSLEANPTYKAVLVLMGDGWMDDRMLKSLSHSR